MWSLRFLSLRPIGRNDVQILTVGLLLCAGIYITSLYSYLLFHVVAESFSIVIAVSLFMIAWNTRQLTTNNYVLFLSIAFLFAGLIDFAHTLAYKGMGIFTGYDANLPTQLWIAARYLQSLSLLAAPWFIDRKLNIRAILVFYLFATILLLAVVFSGTLFPACFVEGTGLTPFKIFSEYIISFILLSSLALLLHHRDKFDRHVLRLIVWSILFTIVSEMAFTFYVSVYGLSNLIGHYFKILAFYLIYRAIIVTGLENPYRLLFRDLQQNREELQIIIDSAPILIFYKDLENRFVRVNKAHADLTGLPREEIEGRTGADVYPDQAEGYREDDREVIASGTAKTSIIEQLDTESGTRWVQTDKIPYRDMNGNITGIIGFSLDITERKQAEDHIKALLSEKELLLKEVHHRIKNNMAVIMSMLSLQAETLTDPSAASSLNDARRRLQSMMVLYDTLYRSADFRAISTKTYLPPLIDKIISNFPNRESVTIETEIDDHILDAKTLSPLGIILNELLTNAMKHAFTGRKEGLLRVSFSVKDNHAILSIEDDGVGVPESVDSKTSPGFGMQLVGMLTEQLEGTIRIERQKGSHFILEFDV